MTRLITLLSLVLTIFQTSYGQIKNDTINTKKQQNHYTIDSNVVAILPFDSSEYWAFWVFKDGKPTNLTNDNLHKIEVILNTCIKDYNKDQEARLKEFLEKDPKYKIDNKNFTIDLTRYKRQYVAILNSKGEKHVWVNCFCKTWDSNWKKDVLLVDEKGNCVFSVKINLTTEQYYQLFAE
jgi:hypothetical protein